MNRYIESTYNVTEYKVSLCGLIIMARDLDRQEYQYTAKGANSDMGYCNHIMHKSEDLSHKSIMLSF